MAEFGPQATELSAPQGAGATVINPVTASPLDNGVASNVSNFLNIFAKGMELDKKAKAEAANNEVLSRFAREQQAINEDQGLAPDAVVRRSRALANKYMGAYPALAKELKEVISGFSQFSQLNEAVDTVKTEEKMRNETITRVASDGYPIRTDMAPEIQNAIIRDWENAKRTDAEFQRTRAKNEESRASGRYTKEMADYDERQTSRRLLNNLAEGKVDSLYAQAIDMRQQIQSGKITLSDAKLHFGRQFTDIERQIAAVSGSNPELAGVYRGMFNDIKGVLGESVDPAAESKVLKDRFDAAIYRVKLAAISDPKVAAVVGVSALFDNAPGVALQAAELIPDLPEKIEGLLRGDTPGGVMPTITGTKADKPIMEMLQKNLDLYSVGTANNMDQTRIDLVASTKGYLRQLGNQGGNAGLTPDKLADAVNFFSSEKFGKFIKENKMNSAELAPAMQTFKMYYNDKVIPLVDSALEKSRFIDVDQQTYNRALARGEILSRKGKANPEQLVAEFDGTSVKFSAPAGARLEEASAKELNTAGVAISKMVKLSANLEGRSPKEIWEERKYEYLPRIYPVKPGTVINGYKYTGNGDWKDKSNYTKVDGNE